MKSPGILFWIGFISVLVIIAVYYQGLVADTNALGPYAIQVLELAQGRNPSTGNFSSYPTGG